MFYWVLLVIRTQVSMCHIVRHISAFPFKKLSNLHENNHALVEQIKLASYAARTEIEALRSSFMYTGNLKRKPREFETGDLVSLFIISWAGIYRIPIGKKLAGY